MKKLIILLDTDRKEDLDRFAGIFNSGQEIMVMPDAGMKILRIDGLEVTQVYPEVDPMDEVQKIPLMEVENPGKALKELREEIEPMNTPKGTKQRDKARDKMLKKAEKETSVRKSKTYTPEVINFVKKTMEGKTNDEVVKLINERFDIGYTKNKLKGLMQWAELKRVNIIRPRGAYKKKEDKDMTVKEFPRLKINGVEVPKKIMKLVESKKHAESLEIRDDIIEIFGVNYKQSEIRAMQAEFVDKKKLPPQEW